MRARINLIIFFFLLGFILLGARLFYWQIIKANDLVQEAKFQYQSQKVVASQRGNILATDGSFLAARRESWLLYLSKPSLKEKPASLAYKLAPILNFDEIELKELISKEGAIWIPIKHKLTADTKKNIEALKIEGLGFDPEEDRFYPEASAAAHLLGFVGKNDDGADIGYFGLEGFYDLILSGKKGFSAEDKDLRGLPIPLGNSRETSALKGVDLITHIDKTVQLILERKLLEGIQKYEAKGGTVIVADPKTGAILGMSSFPSFEPALYFNYGNAYFKNPAVSDAFEPGSVFKVIVMASAIDAGVVEPETICEICGGPLKLDKYEIETWDKKYYPDSTLTDVIVHSDNVGMAFTGQKLGANAMYDYLTKFGIGELTNIDLQGESSPPLRKKGTWNSVDLATASFGQGVAVTPIQIVRAVSAIANGGYLPVPQVVKAIRSDSWQENIKPKLEKIISEETARKVTFMMTEAAKKGESKWTNLTGFSVAGKTGTAQIPIAGHYDSENVIASFIGFSPSENPKFIMLVTLKEPQTSHWASETAAPLWYAIAKDLFPYFGIYPQN